MQYRKDDDLEFLQYVSSQDLDELVRILTEPRTEELTGRERYKHFNPDHHKYWEEIATELQHYGGNTFSNLVRRKGILYKEILQDVCENLGVEFNSSFSTEKMEDSLLKFEKKTGFVDNLKQAIKNNTKLKDILIFLASSPLRTFSAVPWLAKKLTDPAFRVTIEATTEIAKLRKKYQLEQRNTKHPLPNKIDIKYSDEIILKDENSDSPMAKVMVIDETSAQEIELNKSDTENINRMQHFIADVFKGAISIPNQTVELIFTPETLKGLKNGTLTMIEGRTIVIDGNKKIVEHAQILNGGNLRQFLTGGYQVLSIAVAQSHLADISKSLDDIKDILEQIKEKQNNQDISKLEGPIEYLSVIIQGLVHGKNELSSPQLNEIESIIKDCSTWEREILNEIDSLNERIKNLKDSDTFGSGNTFDELKKLIKNYKVLETRYELILKLKFLLYVITKLFDINKELTQVEINIEKYEDYRNKLYKEIMNKKEKFLNTQFNKGYTLNDRKKIISIEMEELNRDFENLKSFYDASLQKIENSFNGKSSVLLSFDENANIDGYAIKV